MARQNINVFEKHLEKMVLGIVVLLLVWVVVSYLWASPNKVSLDGSMVAPGEIDKRVQARAEEVLQRMRSAKAETVEVIDYPAQQRALTPGPLRRKDRQITANLRRSVSFGTPVPQVEAPLSSGQVSLAGLIPTDQPQVTLGRISALFPPHPVPIGEDLTDVERDLMEFDGPQDKSWVTVAARFDKEKQEQVFADHNYQTNRYEVIAADVLLQRQERLPNGQWSPWKDFQDFSEYHMDAPPELTLSTVGDSQAVPPFQQEALRIWYENLIEFQRDLIRPIMVEAEFGDRWRPPLLNLLVKLYPSEYFEDYVQVQRPEDGKKRKLPPLKQARQNIEESQRLLDQGNLEEALVLVEWIIDHRKISARSNVKKRALELELEITRRLDEIERRKIAEGIADGVGGDDLEEEPYRFEEVFFAHDVTAEPGGTYRYRLKIKAFNQYATIVQRLKDPQQATQVYIESEWSPPSAPVTVPALQRVYLTSAKVDGQKSEGRFELFKWVQGQWVKAQFTAALGERIGGSRKVAHNAQGRINVDFDAGAVLLNLNPEKTYVPLKKRRDGSATLTEPEAAVAALCQKDNGDVFELIDLATKDDEERRTIEDEIDEVKQGKRGGSSSATRSSPRGGSGSRRDRGGG